MFKYTRELRGIDYKTFKYTREFDYQLFKGTFTPTRLNDCPLYMSPMIILLLMEITRIELIRYHI